MHSDVKYLPCLLTLCVVCCSVADVHVQPPTDPEAYLVSCIPGVGPKTAALIVAALGGESVRDVLNSDGAVARLSSIKGIGQLKATKFKREWDANTGEQVHQAQQASQSASLSLHGWWVTL